MDKTTFAIPNFPLSLRRALKILAAERGKTLRDLIIEICKKETGEA